MDEVPEARPNDNATSRPGRRDGTEEHLCCGLEPQLCHDVAETQVGSGRFPRTRENAPPRKHTELEGQLQRVRCAIH